jgi:hypothetical protein
MRFMGTFPILQLALQRNISMPETTRREGYFFPSPAAFLSDVAVGAVVTPADSSAASAKAYAAIFVCPRFNARSLKFMVFEHSRTTSFSMPFAFNSGFDEFEDELVLGLRGIGRVLVARVRRIAHEIAFLGQLEPCRFDLLTQECLFDPV